MSGRAGDMNAGGTVGVAGDAVQTRKAAPLEVARRQGADGRRGRGRPGKVREAA